MVDPLVRRRSAVAGALGGLAVSVLAGCDNGDDLAPPNADPSSASATPSAEAPEQTPDEVLVEGVLEQLTAALAVLGQARKAPTLRQPLAPLVKAHRRHLEVLEGEPTDQPPPAPSTDPNAMLKLVLGGERALQASLVDAAGRAESGALARLLASMSASVTQHLAALPKDA